MFRCFSVPLATPKGFRITPWQPLKNPTISLQTLAAVGVETPATPQTPPSPEKEILMFGVWFLVFATLNPQPPTLNYECHGSRRAFVTDKKCRSAPSLLVWHVSRLKTHPLSEENKSDRFVFLLRAFAVFALGRFRFSVLRFPLALNPQPFVNCPRCPRLSPVLSPLQNHKTPVVIGLSPCPRSRGILAPPPPRYLHSAFCI